MKHLNVVLLAVSLYLGGTLVVATIAEWYECDGIYVREALGYKTYCLPKGYTNE